MRKAKMKRVAFKVSLVQPKGATLTDVKNYVINSVESWRGSLKPPGVDAEDPEGDPMFELDPESVRVTFCRPAGRLK